MTAQSPRKYPRAARVMGVIAVVFVTLAFLGAYGLGFFGLMAGIVAYILHCGPDPNFKGEFSDENAGTMAARMRDDASHRFAKSSGDPYRHPMYR